MRMCQLLRILDGRSERALIAVLVAVDMRVSFGCEGVIDYGLFFVLE
jgi:hypothetical protein